MEITFATNKLRKQCNESKTMIKAHGSQRAKKLMIIMTSLRAVANLGLFAPPYSPPHRCHELTGNMKGLISLDLDHPYRLIIKPVNDPKPERPEGGLDWSKVTAIEIQGVEDTHG
jgi:plasmid maintenance system killer protein